MLLAAATLFMPFFLVPQQAPDLDGGAWLNTSRPLSSWERDLKGQVVLLDFWTSCCINCMHVLPDLARLEKEFQEEPFQVIGVHSAKFEAENQARNVRQAIRRYGIRHPVVVDEGMRIWRAYGVRAWPTLVLVGPTGRPLRMVSGEGNFEHLRREIRAALDRGRGAGTLAEAPLELDRDQARPSLLHYPGKLLASAGRLYVADSSAGRILAVDSESGRIDRIFEADGPPFDHPQGLALLEGALYVADTGNHLIRKVDLQSGKVTTVAGTGRQARPLPRRGPALLRDLNSPWALVADGGLLHIAMAGSHQLWSFDPARSELIHLAGSGREDLQDGPATRAALAQSSGLALIDRRLYFVDSESSSLRWLDLDEKEVHTVFGTGLFDFGDHDGEREEVLLQHPLGLAAWGKKLVLADTFNGKIKIADPEAREIQTMALHDAKGAPMGTWEPGGLSVDGDTLYIADTNHHRILLTQLPGGETRVLLDGRSGH